MTELFFFLTTAVCGTMWAYYYVYHKELKDEIKELKEGKRK